MSLKPGVYVINNLKYNLLTLEFIHDRAVGGRSATTVPWAVQHTGTNAYSLKNSATGKYLAYDVPTGNVFASDQPYGWAILGYQGTYKIGIWKYPRVCELTGSAEGTPVVLKEHSNDKGQFWSFH